MSATHDSMGPVEDPSFDFKQAFELKPGERRGWWKDHDEILPHRATAMVYGAVCNHRTRILLDTGSTTSMISQSLARRLNLKLDYSKRLKMRGIDDHVAFCEATAMVKITLVISVAYYTEVWVGNISSDLDVLLGMNFMVAAGVRIHTSDGTIRLPDEATVKLVDPNEPDLTPSLFNREVPIRAARDIRLNPGFATTIQVDFKGRDPSDTTIWLYRGLKWVTELFWHRGRNPEIRVVNIEDTPCSITRNDVIACLTSASELPSHPGGVRRGSRRYDEWQSLIYENMCSFPGLVLPSLASC